MVAGRTDESVNPQAETNWIFFFHVESVDGEPFFISVKDGTNAIS